MKTTAEALHLSVVQLIQSCRDRGDSAYFWTFTFEDALPPREASRRWDRFSVALRRKYTTLRGVRVYEWHPGHIGAVTDDGNLISHSHGLHIHLVANLWLPVDQVRKIAKRCGFGRIHVKRIDDLTNPDRIACYVAKYLRKGLSDRHPCLKNMRLWANWANWKGTKCKDIVKYTPFTWFWGLCKHIYSFDTSDSWHSIDHLSIKQLRSLWVDYRSAFSSPQYKGQRYHVMIQLRGIFNSMPIFVQNLLAQVTGYQQVNPSREFF